ncbi:unnamed protein product [Pedinophyceae sp. YPF-701]|nr:unnamed protein product [Pedinophyceae sp. YPF-701]
MEFHCRVPGLGDELVSCWDAARLRKLSRDDLASMRTVIDVAGKASGRAQGLPHPVTDLTVLMNTSQRLYVCASRSSANKTTVTGILKVGEKHLFYRSLSGAIRELNPTCVLDIYVHESCQRQGVGRILFDAFLAAENQDPACLAYDRPSPKLRPFLARHFGLASYVPQSNNFVIFDAFFNRGQRQRAPAPPPQRSQSSSAWQSVSSRPLTAQRRPGSRTRSIPHGGADAGLGSLGTALLADPQRRSSGVDAAEASEGARSSRERSDGAGPAWLGGESGEGVRAPGGGEQTWGGVGVRGRRCIRGNDARAPAPPPWAVWNDAPDVAPRPPAARYGRRAMPLC